MGNPKTFSFTLKNDIAELKILCQQLESIGGALGLPQRFVFEINLALDELFTNIISYGFNDHSEHAIQVCIAADNGMLTITVEDDGIPFNPIARAEPRMPATIEDCTIGGLGIYLIKNLMDDVCYRRNQDKNVLTLKKKNRNDLSDYTRPHGFRRSFMDIVEEKEGAIHTFKIKGRLDSNTSQEFEKRIFDVITDGTKNVIIDFKDLDYISSAGLRVILKATKALKRDDGKIMLCAMQDYVKEVFEIAGFDSFLPIVPTLEDARRAL